MRILVLLLCTSLLGACSCQRQPAAETSTPAAEQRPATTTASTDFESAEAVARAASVDARRTRAISDAVDTLHGYLRELGGGQRELAEKRWAYRRSPTVNEESGLRSLTGLQSLRIDNGTPRPLDAEKVPTSLEIPVRLRASMDGGQVLRFNGWYHLRHNPVTTRWELTAASIAPVIR